MKISLLAQRVGPYQDYADVIKNGTVTETTARSLTVEGPLGLNQAFPER